MKRILWISMLFCIASTPALWAIPSEINYQGTLRGPGGVPLNGQQTLKFTLTNVDGSISYSNTITATPILNNGLFATKLNFQLQAGRTWENITPYIKVNVNGADLNPPEKISATLYAVMSDSVVDNAITTAKLDPSVQTSIFVPGMVIAFAGNVAPAGWLLCDGTVYPKSSYLGLSTAIGSTWNTGNEGAGNFRVPDLRGRTAIGAGQGPGLTNRVLGIQNPPIGEETHVLTIQEMPQHSHGVTDNKHTHSFSGGGNAMTTNHVNDVAFGAGAQIGNGAMNASASNISINPEGNSVAHNNMQPSAVITYIIKL